MNKVKINPQEPIRGKGSLTPASGSPRNATDLKALFKPRESQDERELEAYKLMMDGKPLVTKGMTRTINGQVVTTPTKTPLSKREIQEKLKDKNLDPDTRAIYELELKRQEQEGYLTLDQAKQLYDINQRSKEKFWNNFEDQAKQKYDINF